MLRVHCPRHGQDVLLTSRRILAIEGTGPDMTVRWVCYCGHHGAHRPDQSERPRTAVAA